MKVKIRVPETLALIHAFFPKAHQVMEVRDEDGTVVARVLVCKLERVCLEGGSGQQEMVVGGKILPYDDLCLNRDHPGAESEIRIPLELAPGDLVELEIKE